MTKNRLPAAKVGDVRRLLEAARAQTGFRGVRDSTVIALVFDTGLRLSEVAGLTLADLDWQGNSLRVVGKGDKERRVYFGASLRRQLQTYLRSRQAVLGDMQDGPSTALFLTEDGRQLTSSGISTAFKRLKRRVGVTVRFHDLRHAFAAEWIRQGGDPFNLQDQLGHASLDMVRHYVREFKPDRQAKARRYSPYSQLVGRR